VKVSLLDAMATAASQPDIRKAAGDPGVTPTQFNGYSGRFGSPLMTDWSFERAILDGYKACSWVFACLDRLGGACSSVPWRVLEKRGKKRSEWEAQDGHPTEMAIEYPNDHMSRQLLINVMVLHLGLVGNGLLKNVTVTRKGEQQPDELWPLSPARYKPVPIDEDAPPIFRNGRQLTWIEGYRRTDRPYLPLLAPEQVVHMQFVDPGVLIWGMPPLQALARAVDMDVRHVAWNAAMPDNHMVPPGAFVDRNLKTDGQIEEAARRLQQRYGAPNKARVPLVLGAGTDWLRMALSPAEMDWIESRQFTMVEICACFGLIPTIFIPDAKYSNQESGKKYMWQNGAHRYLTVIEDAFNTRFVPRRRRAEMYIHFDLSVIPEIQDTLPARLEAHERAVRSGIPANRSFIMLDLPVDPVEGGDKPLVLGTLVSLEQLVAEPEEAKPSPDDGEDDNSPRPADPAGKGQKAEPPAPAPAGGS
jgi:HK97 family phage portal protein